MIKSAQRSLAGGLAAVMMLLSATPNLKPKPQTQQPGASPKEALDPRTYRELKDISSRDIYDLLADRQADQTRDTKNQLNVVIQQHAMLMEQIRAIQEQMKLLMQIQNIVAADTERIAGLDHRLAGIEDRVRRAEDVEAPDKSEIVELRVMISGAYKIAIWCLSGIGALLLGLGSYAGRQAILAMSRKRRHYDSERTIRGHERDESI